MSEERLETPVLYSNCVVKCNAHDIPTRENENRTTMNGRAQ